MRACYDRGIQTDSSEDVSVKYLSITAAALAFGAVAAPPPAHAAVKVTLIKGPPGVNCAGAKISTVFGTSRYWGVMNCGGFAYKFWTTAGPKLHVAQLPLLPGAIGSFASDVDDQGTDVGYQLRKPAAQVPVIWPHGGPPAVLPGPAPAAALGIDGAGGPGPIVGFAQSAGNAQAFWFNPGPFFIPPAGPSTAYDVSSQLGLYVGQTGGIAAAAIAPGPLVALPGAGPNSVALATNEAGLIAGHQDLGAGCGPLPLGFAFFFQWAAGPFTPVGPLPGDCTAGFEDVNIDVHTGAKTFVGYSANAAVHSAMALDLNPNYLLPGKVNLNAIPGFVHLTDAPGVDDFGDVLVTDGGHVPSVVYVLTHVP
jgi:hypothetical protein